MCAAVARTKSFTAVFSAISLEDPQVEKAVEGQKPLGRHPANFRNFTIQVSGKQIPFAIMAHPEKYGSPYGGGIKPDEGIDSRAALCKIQAAGFKVLLALEESEFEVIQTRWDSLAQGKEGYAIHLTPIKDHEPPSLSSLCHIMGLVEGSIKAGLPVAVYCGAGFGRSGTIGTALVLTEMVQHEATQGINSSLEGRSVEIDLLDGELDKTTPLVAAALRVMRAKDPIYCNLQSKNARSSTVGITVEVVEQVRVLETWEQHLRQKVVV